MIWSQKKIMKIELIDIVRKLDQASNIVHLAESELSSYHQRAKELKEFNYLVAGRGFIKDTLFPIKSTNNYLREAEKTLKEYFKLVDTYFEQHSTTRERWYKRGKT